MDIPQENIEPHNDKDQRHGEWQEFDSDGTPWLKGSYHKDEPIGYWEWYNTDKPGIFQQHFYIL